MGIGYPEDLLTAIALGADMFDCVYPTRTARFGNALTHHGTLNLKNARFSNDFAPIESGCGCVVCKPAELGGLGVSRAYIYHLAAKETVGAHLVTLHNVFFMLDLMREAREAIRGDVYPGFVRGFFGTYFGDKGTPAWAVDALSGVGIEV